MAFDRTSSSFFVADGGSNSGGVWRMHWNPTTATIDAAVRIAHLGEDRATGVALAPTGPIGIDGKHANEVYLTTKGSTAVLRIADPQGAAAAPAVAGHARGAGASSLAVLDGDLYIAEDIEPDDDDPTFPPPVVATNGVSRLSLDTGGTAVAVRGLDGGLSHAVATDRCAAACTWGRRPATWSTTSMCSTSTPAASRRTRPGSRRSPPWASRPTATCSSPTIPARAPSSSTARDGADLARRPADARPAGARHPAGPPVTSNHTRATFAYTSRAGALFECRLDGAACAACPGTGAGTVSYDALTEGVHAFDVHAIDAAPGSPPGRSLRRTFIVDLTAPSVTHRLPPRRRAPPRRADRARVLGGEHGVAFTCSLDGAAPSRAARAGRCRPCASAPTRCASRASISPATPARRPTQPPSGASSSPPRPPRRAPPPPATAVAPAALPAARIAAAPRTVPTTRARSGHRAAHDDPRRAHRRRAARPWRASRRQRPLRRHARRAVRTPHAARLRGRCAGPRARQHGSPRLPRRARPHDVAAQPAAGPAAARRSLPADGGDGAAAVGAHHRLDGCLRVRPALRTPPSADEGRSDARAAAHDRRTAPARRPRGGDVRRRAHGAP